MAWHAYKYLAKAVHRSFFPIFAILENMDLKVGQKVVAQRKLLFLEKMYGALLVAAPRLRAQLSERIRGLSQEQEAGGGLQKKKKVLLVILKALQDLVCFYLPAIFRVGYLVRCCTWEGREPRSSGKVREALEEVLLLLVHMLKDTCAKNEYVRTVAVTLLTWQRWNSQLPSCCYMEESCEALLSRMGHRCSAHRHVSGFSATFDLFMTLPPPSRQLKATRGILKDDLISTFAARMRYIVNSGGSLPCAEAVGPKQMHSVVSDVFKEDVEFPEALPKTISAAILEEVLRRALLCMSGRGRINEHVQDWLKSNVAVTRGDAATEYQRAMENFKKLNSKKKDKEKAAPSRRVLPPKPRARFNPVMCYVCFHPPFHSFHTLSKNELAIASEKLKGPFSMCIHMSLEAASSSTSVFYPHEPPLLVASIARVAHESESSSSDDVSHILFLKRSFH